MMDYPTKLYRIREELGMKRSFLAEKSGVPIRTLEKLERGETDPNKTSAINIYNISSVLGVEVSDILNIK